ncbi:enoyl-CoA hydratase [Salinisphaera sp. S4-8]|uniref:enoyl-CoA hydratase/isomerase family protein n=1 Tax=Salinisphaera sp. S4-8 TaxID=633357 RepID=UPI00333E6854
MFTYELENAIAHLTIDRPSAYNAIDPDGGRELCDIVNAMCSDPAVRAVLIRGTGEKAFCAGGDVGGFAQSGSRLPAEIREMAGNLHMSIARLSRMDAPVIAAVNGVAAGAGLGIVAASDYVLAAEHATFSSAFTAIGLSPDSSTTWYLPRIVGYRRVMELLLTNRRLSAAEAHEWGLVNQVVAAEDFDAEVTSFAERLAAGPTAAYGAVKRLVRASLADTLETHLEDEAVSLSQMAASADGMEGVAAFAQKRKPEFGGQG